MAYACGAKLILECKTKGVKLKTRKEVVLCLFCMSQFMENYDYEYANETRTFEYRNISVREYGKEEWTTILTADLSVDTFCDTFTID